MKRAQRNCKKTTNGIFNNQLLPIGVGLAPSCTPLFAKSLQGCDVKWKSSLPLPSSFPWLARLSRSLFFCPSSRLSPSLWAVAGFSQRKWCSPSGVVVNMLGGERAFGRGHMKTSYALNPQPNPGVHYNGENHFGGGGTSGKTTKLWEMFLRQPRDHFIFFWLLSAIWVGIVQGENQITHKVSFLKCLSFVCGNKWLRCLLVPLSLLFPLDPLKRCDRCTQHDFWVQ